MKRAFVAGAGIFIVGVTFLSPAWAQTRNQGQAGQLPSAQSPLPPALQAAILSGNSQAVSQAIATLSGGNPVQAANLAAAAVTAAEKMLYVSPQAAVQAALAAVATVRSPAVATAAQIQTEQVVTTAARIFNVPDMLQRVPERAAELATRAMEAAAATGNPALIGATCVQAVSAAEKILMVNPVSAVAVAAVAVQSVKPQQILQAAPQPSMQVATIAGRITSCVQIVSDPSVYAMGPAAALSVMANSYAAATSHTVLAAVPTVTTLLVRELNRAAETAVLNRMNPLHSKDIQQILEGRMPPQI